MLRNNPRGACGACYQNKRSYNLGKKAKSKEPTAQDEIYIQSNLKTLFSKHCQANNLTHAFKESHIQIKPNAAGKLNTEQQLVELLEKLQPQPKVPMAESGTQSPENLPKELQSANPLEELELISPQAPPKEESPRMALLQSSSLFRQEPFSLEAEGTHSISALQSRLSKLNNFDRDSGWAGSQRNRTMEGPMLQVRVAGAGASQLAANQMIKIQDESLFMEAPSVTSAERKEPLLDQEDFLLKSHSGFHITGR